MNGLQQAISVAVLEKYHQNRSEIRRISADCAAGLFPDSDAIRTGKILVVTNLETSFVSIDFKILAEAYGAKLLVASRGFRGLLKVFWASLVYPAGLGWFASWHTLPAALGSSLVRHPFLLIVGGYDLANMPEIGYGHQRGGIKKWISRATIALASRLITNSEYSRQEAFRNVGIDPRRLAAVYHGVDDRFGSLPNKRSKPLVVTVGNVDRANLMRKGHEPFVRSAAFLPEFEFRLIGSWRDDAIEHLRDISTPNVVFSGRISDEELRETLSEATVYVQASAHEGFGMSLAEAMLAGCVPVTTAEGAIPEVVGTAGITIASTAPDVLAKAILEGVSRVDELGPRAREQIRQRFPLEVRSVGLLREMEALFGASGMVL